MVRRAYTIHDLPSSERPRERLQQYGSTALSITELLALILGQGTKGESVLLTAQKLISHFGSLENLSNASLQDLLKIHGLGIAKASQIQSCFELARRCQNQFSDVTTSKKKELSLQALCMSIRTKIQSTMKEHFFVISLDARFKIIAIDTVAIGILNASIVHPREVFDTALHRHAAAIIVSHNHPSGDPLPSDQDIQLTQRLFEAGKLMGIEVMDHIIITKEKYYSLKEGKVISY